MENNLLRNKLLRKSQDKYLQISKLKIYDLRYCVKASIGVNNFGLILVWLENNVCYI